MEVKKTDCSLCAPPYCCDVIYVHVGKLMLHRSYITLFRVRGRFFREQRNAPVRLDSSSDVSMTWHSQRDFVSRPSGRLWGRRHACLILLTCSDCVCLVIFPWVLCSYHGWVGCNRGAQCERQTYLNLLFYLLYVSLAASGWIFIPNQ